MALRHFIQDRLNIWICFEQGSPHGLARFAQFRPGGLVSWILLGFGVGGAQLFAFSRRQVCEEGVLAMASVPFNGGGRSGVICVWVLSNGQRRKSNEGAERHDSD